MRIPSEEAFTALEMGMTSNEREALLSHYDPEYHSEHAAFLVLTALRNDVSLTQVKKISDRKLDSASGMKKLISTVSPKTSESQMDSFFWSIPLDYKDADRIYLTSAFLAFGQSFSSLLVSFRATNSTNVPELVPVSWFKKFFDGEASLREEGIVLQTDVSMVLFGYWEIGDVIDFLVRNVDLKEVTKLRAAGIETADEIATITELLPEEWLNDFFG